MELIAHHRAAAYRAGAVRRSAGGGVRGPRRRRRGRLRARRASSGRSRSPATRSSWPEPRSSGRARWRRPATPRSSRSTGWVPGRRCARRPTSCAAETPGDRARLADHLRLRAMIPTRAPGPDADTAAGRGRSRPYLELGLTCAADERQRGARQAARLAGVLGFRLRDRTCGRRAASRATPQPGVRARWRGGLERPDLELIALDALYLRAQYPRALRPCRAHRSRAARDRAHDPRSVRGRRQLLHRRLVAPWTSAITAESSRSPPSSEALEARVCPSGRLALRCSPRCRSVEWDAALADQARLRELLGDRASPPPSMASGGHGAEAFIHQAREEHAAADAVLAEIEAWNTLGRVAAQVGERPGGAALARKGDFAAARRTPRHPGRQRRLPRPRARSPLRADRRGGDVGRGRRRGRRSPPARGRRPAPGASVPRGQAGGPRAARRRRSRGRGRLARTRRPRVRRPLGRLGRLRSAISRWARRSRRWREATRHERCSRAPPRCSSGCGFRASSSRPARCSGRAPAD